MLVMTWVQPKSMGFWNAGFLEGERSVDHSWVACAYSCVMVSLARFLLLVVVAAAQKLVPFDGAAASSQYSSHSFAADLALGESSGWRLLVASKDAHCVKTPVEQVLVQRRVRVCVCVCVGLSVFAQEPCAR